MPDERAELERLRVETTELRMDREFGEKAAAAFTPITTLPGQTRHPVRIWSTERLMPVCWAPCGWSTSSATRRC